MVNNNIYPLEMIEYNIFYGIMLIKMGRYIINKLLYKLVLWEVIIWITKKDLIGLVN